jgi:hypothetical protein
MVETGLIGDIITTRSGQVDLLLFLLLLVIYKYLPLASIEPSVVNKAESLNN